MRLGLGAEHRLPEVVRVLLIGVDRVVVRAEDRHFLGVGAQVDGGCVHEQGPESVAHDGDRRVTRLVERHSGPFYHGLPGRQPGSTGVAVFSADHVRRCRSVGDGERSETVGPYELGEVLGEGTTGVVYRAVDEEGRGGAQAHSS